MMGFKIVIPARHSSSRLPGKPLLDIAGKPMVLRVLDRALEAGAEEVWVATDHQGIADVVERAGGKVVLTAAEHPPVPTALRKSPRASAGPTIR